MACCSKSCCLGVGWFFCVLAFASFLLAMSTDYWYWYDTTDVKDAAIRKKYDFYFGITKTCFKSYNVSVAPYYRNDPAVSSTRDQSKYSMVLCYERMFRKIDNPKGQDKFDLLQTAMYSCIQIALGLLFLTNWWLVAGVWSKESRSKKKCFLAMAGLFSFFGCLAGAATLISFIAQRQYEDGDKDHFPRVEGLKAGYGWSFMQAWSGVGLSLLSSFLITLSALRHSDCCGADDMEKAFDLTPSQYPGIKY